jgi:hypothetical protein
MELIRKSHHADNYNALRPFIQTRWSQLCQEFAFFPSAPPHNEGGIFELRSYTLKPGALLEWENAWRVGIEARAKVVAPVGAWFSQIGRLHVVHHMWQYKSVLIHPKASLSHSLTQSQRSEYTEAYAREGLVSSGMAGNCRENVKVDGSHGRFNLNSSSVQPPQVSNNTNRYRWIGRSDWTSPLSYFTRLCRRFDSSMQMFLSRRLSPMQWL